MRPSFENVRNAVPQALGDMLDSVQAGEEKKSSSSPAEPAAPVAATAPPLVKKAVLNAAIAHLERTFDPQLHEETSASVPRNPQGQQAQQTPQSSDSAPSSPAANRTRNDASTTTSQPQSRAQAGTTSSKTPSGNTPAPSQAITQPPAGRTPTLTGRLAESPAALLAALLTDDEPALPQDLQRPQTKTDRTSQGSVLRPPAQTTGSDTEKTGASLLSVTQKLLKTVSEEPNPAAHTPQDARRLGKDESNGVVGSAVSWQKSDKRHDKDLCKPDSFAAQQRVEGEKGSAPISHPFPPATPETPSSLPSLLLPVVIGAVLASLLIVILLVITR